MKLLIAEKPNLAKNIMMAIGLSKFKWEDCYAESNEYIVTWAFGHLFELKDLDDYISRSGPSGGREGWTLDNLPFCPKQFQYELKKNKDRKTDAGVRKQFSAIKKLLERADVDSVIHAGDADREGEIIIRTILEMAGNKKPVYRLWLPAQTPEDVLEGLRDMKPDYQYNRLAAEGYARTYVDWLFGINLSRTASIQSGTSLRVGRVIVPIVKAIYDRDMEIKNFKPITYLVVGSEAETSGEKIRLTHKNTYSREDRALAQDLADHLNSMTATVSDVRTDEKTISAGKLLNQSRLQALAGKKYKISPKETLDIAQKLYEGGYTTYPRTPSEYLASSERHKTNRIISALQERGYQVTAKDTLKSIYDDTKVESHSAITPTLKFPEKGILSSREQQVYDIILNRFLAVFCSEPCKVAHTTLTITAGSETFRLTGDVFLQRGWMQYDDPGRSDKTLPNLRIGDTVNTDFRVIEKKTTPPAHYTVETLGRFLCNPFKKVKPPTIDAEGEGGDSEEADPLLTEDEFPDDFEDYKAVLEGLEIGTEATRAGIIDKAIHSKYISLRNNQYTILPGGIYYIESLWKMGIIMDKYKTAQLGRALKQVYCGELTIQECVDRAMSEVRDFYTKAVSTQISAADPVNGICKCPLCDGFILEGKKSYYCSNHKTCTLSGLWKQAFYINLTHKDIIALVKGSVITKPYKTKSGVKSFKKLRYAADRGQILDVTNEPMTIGRSKTGRNSDLLLCPSCKGKIIERPQSYSCSETGCGFVLWKEARYFKNTLKITPAKAKQLLSGNRVLFTLTNKEGKEYEGYLKLVVNGKYAHFESDGYPPKKRKKAAEK